MYSENFTKYPNTRPKLVIGYTVRHKTCARKGIIIYVWHNECSMEKEHTVIYHFCLGPTPPETAKTWHPLREIVSSVPSWAFKYNTLSPKLACRSDGIISLPTCFNVVLLQSPHTSGATHTFPCTQKSKPTISWEFDFTRSSKLMLQKNLAKLNFNQYLELYKPKETKSGNCQKNFFPGLQTELEIIWYISLNLRRCASILLNGQKEGERWNQIEHKHQQ